MTMKTLLALSTILLIACSTTSTPLKIPDSLQEAVGSGFRSPENKLRDQYRHPLETLTFFGLKPEMTVIEVTPGKGWYMEIIAPYLSQKGLYIMAIPVPEKSYEKENEASINSWKEKFPQVGEKIKYVLFSEKDIKLPEDGSVDMILTFRNVHNWMKEKFARDAFDAFFKALRPGGILGVVEHRANPGAKDDPFAKNGYVKEQDVIEMAITAGFRLVGSSEINSNPNDTKDYPEGVWSLPPTLKLGNKDRNKYLAIGESDRMTLKFIKPKN
jgi:predicted methyltransferase